MSDASDDSFPNGLDLELDLSGVPESRARVLSASDGDSPTVSHESPEEWSLELEDIAPPVSATEPRATQAAHTMPVVAVPRLTQPAEPSPVRTLELRIAQVVDRMPPSVRVSLLVFSVAVMLLFATAMLLNGVRTALGTVEQLRQANPVTAPRPTSVQESGRRDPYEAYRVDDVVDVDDDGRHLPQREPR